MNQHRVDRPPPSPHSAAAESRPRLLYDRRSRRQAVIVGIMGVALFFAAQTAIGLVVRGRPVPWARVLGMELYYWYLLAAFLPIVLWLARRLRVERANWRRTVPAHAAAALAVGLVHSVLYYGVLAALAAGGGGGEAPADAAAAVDAVVRQLPTAMLTIFWKYAVMLGIFYAFDYREKYRERELRAVQLEARLTDARLNALEMQLHPHFLFNTLHSIAMLNLEDPDDANRMLTRLSELLRTALEHVGAQEITLAEELEFVGRYLEIERLRFRDRLIVTYDIDPALLSAHVPNLVLQPLVENAVRHGVANRTDGGRIDVSARSEGARIVLEVRDDGGGLPPSWRLERDGGIGLTNTRDRLAGLYGDMGGLELTNEAGGGVTARVWLPLRIRDGDDPSDPPAAAAAVPSFAEPDRTGRDASEPGIDR